MDLSKVNPKRGDTFLLVKDMAGTAIFTRLTLGANSIKTETGRLDEPDNVKQRIITFTARGAKPPSEVASDQIKRDIAVLVDRHYEVKEGTVTSPDKIPHFGGRFSKTTKTAVKARAKKGDVFARYYSGTPVEVTVTPEGTITATSSHGQIELPNRIRSGLHKSREPDTYTLHGILTWVAPTQEDHATKKSADFHGGSKPNLVLYDISSADEDEVFAIRSERLLDLCQRNRWTSADSRSSLYHVGLHNEYPDLPGVATRWTGVVAVGDSEKWSAVVLNESEYFVIVGGTEDRDKVALIRHSDDDGLVPYGTARVPKSMRDTIRDLCVYDSQYKDVKNYTKRKSSDFGQKSNTIKWMHPKDYFVVSVNRRVLERIALGKDVQSVEVAPSD